MDVELLLLDLELDAVWVAELTMRGRTIEADAHIARSGFTARLHEWRRLNGRR